MGGTAAPLPKALATVYIPASRLLGSTVLCIITNTCYYLFDSSHPSGSQVVACCGFDLYFPEDLSQEGWR